MGIDNKKVNLLIVEDDPIIRSVCNRILIRKGFNITVAIGWEYGVEAVRE